MDQFLNTVKLLLSCSLLRSVCLKHYYGEGVTFGCGLSEMKLFFAGRQVRPRTLSD
jgi:hypothetical protein